MNYFTVFLTGRSSKQQLIKEITDLAHTKKALDNTSEVCYNKSENSNNGGYAEEISTQNVDQSFAQANNAEVSPETIGRTKDNLDEEYIPLVSRNTADKIFHPFSVSSLCKVECREKVALKYEFACRCHSPP